MNNAPPAPEPQAPLPAIPPPPPPPCVDTEDELWEDKEGDDCSVYAATTKCFDLVRGAEGNSSCCATCQRVVAATNAGCPTTNDGTCDVPGSCAPGTDEADCGCLDCCVYSKDGECDEPRYITVFPWPFTVIPLPVAAFLCLFYCLSLTFISLPCRYCIPGTDTEDCSADDALCPYTNDGECDEPEGGTGEVKHPQFAMSLSISWHVSHFSADS